MVASQTSRRAVVLLLVVFVLGVALGAVGTYFAGARVWGARSEAHAPQDRRARMVEQMARELNLTPDQRNQIDSILADVQTKYAALHEQISPQTEQVRQQGRERIRALLQPEQKPKFEEFLRRMDEERKKKYGR